MKAPRRFWTEREDAELRRRYARTPVVQTAQRLKRTVLAVYQRAGGLGLHRDRSYLNDLGAGLAAAGRDTRFKKGLIPANKGLRRPGYAPGRMAETQFKTGERTGIALRNWRPIGTVLKDSDGYLRIKIREGKKGEASGFGNVRIWPLLQRYVWERAHGPIPAGHAVAFRNGDRSDCDLRNLELITRRELMARNTLHNLPKPLALAIQLNGALKRRLRRMDEELDDGLAQPPVRDAGAVEGQGRAHGH